MLAINDDAVTIKEIELAIVERAFAEGWVGRVPPSPRPAGRWRSSAPARPASRPPSSSRAPATP